MPGGIFREGLQQLERVAGRAGSDTIKLWDGYREQAYLWRSIALLLVPVTVMSLIMALVMYFFAETIIEVPQVPQPGHYSVDELPDSAFINMAQQVVNLIATFQPETVEGQYDKVRQFLWEPALTALQKYRNVHLPKMIETRRSQSYFIVPNLTRVVRSRDTVTVIFRGQRNKTIGKDALKSDEVIYRIRMITIPRNISNIYGIVVIGINAEEPKMGNKNARGQ